MLLFRWLILMLLLGSVVSFSFYASTVLVRYRRICLLALKWTLIAAFGFCAVRVV